MNAKQFSLSTNVKIINKFDWIKADQNSEFDHSNSKPVVRNQNSITQILYKANIFHHCCSC